MSICYLIGAGEFHGQISAEDDDLIIAVDGGYDNLVRYGYTPDILIGDLDSIKSEVPESMRCVRYPKEKDETDMLLAYEAGIKLGYSEFVMLGATGGRLDHTYANISLLLYAKESTGLPTMVITTSGTNFVQSFAKSSIACQLPMPNFGRHSLRYSSGSGVFREMDTVSTSPFSFAAVGSPWMRSESPLVFTRTCMPGLVSLTCLATERRSSRRSVGSP